MKFNEILKNLREEKKVTQKDLADAVYVSRSTVAKWENGLVAPSEDNIRDLCEYFHVNRNVLLGEESEWAKEVEEIKKARSTFNKKEYCILGGVAIAVIAVVMMILFIPSKRKNILYGINLTSESRANVVITKEYSLFSYGEVYVDYYTGDELPDVITMRNGNLKRHYRVTSMQACAAENVYVPSYVKEFRTWEGGYLGDPGYFAEEASFGWNRHHDLTVLGIEVSKNNPYFTSMDGSCCIVESSTGKLLLGCCATVIPSGVTEIGEYAFYDRIPTQVVIPSSCKIIRSCAFSSFDSATDSNLHTKLDLGDGVEVIEKNAFRYYRGTVSEIVLPLSLKSISEDSFYRVMVKNNVIYYSGSQEEFEQIEFTDQTQDERSFYVYNTAYAAVYYYSYIEPAVKGSYWHYVDSEVTMW